MRKVHRYKLNSYFGGYAMCVKPLTEGRMELTKIGEYVTCKRCLKIMEKK